MQLVELECNLPEDVRAFVRAEVASGRYASEDEVLVHALYLQAQELERKGFATPETRAALTRSLVQTLDEFRQALTAKLARSSHGS